MAEKRDLIIEVTTPHGLDDVSDVITALGSAVYRLSDTIAKEGGTPLWNTVTVGLEHLETTTFASGDRNVHITMVMGVEYMVTKK